MWVVEKAPPGGCRRGLVFKLSLGCSFCRDDLGDGGSGGGFVDDLLVCGEGGDKGGDGEVVDGAGFAAAGVMDQGEGVVGEQGVGASGDLQVVADVAGGLLAGHAVHLEADRDALVEG